MPHVRQQIIDEIGTTLTGLTTTGARVYPSRVDPLSGSEVPGLLIYDTEDTPDDEQSTLIHQYRNAIIVIEAFATGAAGDAVSQTLNTIASEIEVAIFGDVTRGNIALGTFYRQTSKTYDSEAAVVAGVMRMEFSVDYMTETGVPDTPIT